MRKIAAILMFTLISMPLWSQSKKDISWETKAVKTAPNEYDIIFTATLTDGWHVYSQFIEQGGPIPTTFTYTKGNYSLVGKTEEKGHAEKIFDPNFEMNLIFFSGKADFVQHIKLSGPTETVSGSFEFMICNDKMCLPPENIPFTVPVQYQTVGAK
ncbi:MAG: hypothetical protein EOP53_02875 [Sphingobacteriales bacterium]|nr:MAG: hypothetical protein EOP53_02875 [Sphingobacteriales bacterium]